MPGPHQEDRAFGRNEMPFKKWAVAVTPTGNAPVSLGSVPPCEDPFRDAHGRVGAWARRLPQRLARRIGEGRVARKPKTTSCSARTSRILRWEDFLFDFSAPFLTLARSNTTQTSRSTRPVTPLCVTVRHLGGQTAPCTGSSEDAHATPSLRRLLFSPLPPTGSV